MPQTCLDGEAICSEVDEEVASGAIHTLRGYRYLEEYGLAKFIAMSACARFTLVRSMSSACSSPAVFKENFKWRPIQ